jgi:hypothetical protein
LIRLKCGGSLGEAENTEARKGGERAEEQAFHRAPYRDGVDLSRILYSLNDCRIHLRQGTKAFNRQTEELALGLVLFGTRALTAWEPGLALGDIFQNQRPTGEIAAASMQPWC